MSNIFLGMQQALVWSATIFIMIDYLGQVPASTCPIPHLYIHLYPYVKGKATAGGMAAILCSG